VSISAVAASLLGIYLIGIAMNNTDTSKRRMESADKINHLINMYIREPGNRQFVAAISAYARSDYQFERIYAISAIGRIGTASKDDFVEVLVDGLQSEIQGVEREAAIALGQLGEYASPAVNLLIEKLFSYNEDVGWFSAESLGLIGPSAAKAIPALSQAAISGNQIMEENALEAIRRITRNVEQK